MTISRSLTQVEPVESLIRVIRGQRVVLDADLARIYGVTTARLNQQVRRNLDRFPADFMFQLTTEELASLMLQNATSKPARGGRRKPPFAFTEYGVIQAANVLNSDEAARTSLFLVRAFVKMREALVAHRELAAKVAELERNLAGRLDLHDHLISGIFKELHRLANPPRPERKQIGFQVQERPAAYRVKRKS
jgi:hypothetical protein